MKILLHSNAPWASSGYGSQTALFAPLFKAAGHDVAISAFWGLYGSDLEWNDIKVYPGGGNSYGAEMIPLYAFDHSGRTDPKSVQVITLMDVWALTNDMLRELSVASWTPVDHDPAPARVVEFFTRTQATPIAMSRFGEAKLQEAGLNPLYVPHGVDTEILQPIDKAEAREKLGVPQDAFLVGMVAANNGCQPPRKAFPEAFRAFAEFQRTHDNALLYVHTLMGADSGGRNGLNLDVLAQVMGIPENVVTFPDQLQMRLGFPYHLMPLIYSAFDVLLNPSYGEGFGIPIVEAQACGVPVIVNDCTSMSELAGPGWAVGGVPFFDVPNGAYWQLPSVPDIVGALEEAYADAGNRREAAREFALAYDVHTVMADYWTPVLETLGRPREVPPLPGLSSEQRAALIKTRKKAA